MALHQSGNVLATFHFFIEKATSQILTVAIEQLMHDSGMQLQELAAVAISRGPGSYTGLRIGTATAKGLCYVLQKPLIAVHTLAAMVADVRRFFVSQGYYFCPMIDARRMEVYCAVYTDKLEEISPVEAKVVDENSFSDLLVTNRVVFFGNGAAKCQKLLAHQPNALFVDQIFPSAYYVGELAWQYWQSATFENVETFEPFYLKEFVGAKQPSNQA